MGSLFATSGVTVMLDWTFLKDNEAMVMILLVAATLFFTAAMFVLALVKLVSRRRPDLEGITNAIQVKLYQDNQDAVVHATSGIPTLQQLTRGLDIHPRRMGLVNLLYDIGLEQFTRPVNNRDGAIAEARTAMEELKSRISKGEVALAERIAFQLVKESEDISVDEEASIELRREYEALSPDAQVFSQHKRREYEITMTIANDLEHRVPRTDYTTVRERIAQGNADLESIINELPIPWQEIRTINENTQRPTVVEKPPKREFLYVQFMTKERGLLEDKRAERDGDWIESAKYGFLTPYRDPIPLRHLVAHGLPLVQVGEVIVINSDPGPEWETEFWRKGGRMDQTYLRARDGRAPEQLRRAYRKKISNRIAFAIGTVFLILDIILVWNLYL